MLTALFFVLHSPCTEYAPNKREKREGAIKEKGEALKEKERLLANAIEGMRGKGMDTGAIASLLGLSEAAMDRYVHGLSDGIQANSVRFTGLTVDRTLFVFPPPLCFSGTARRGSGCRERVAGESRP